MQLLVACHVVSRRVVSVVMAGHALSQALADRSSGLLIKSRFFRRKDYLISISLAFITIVLKVDL